jgi:hypothetical protein
MELFFLKNDGSIYFIDNSDNNKSSICDIDAEFVDIDLGEYFICALSNDGKIYVRGNYVEEDDFADDIMRDFDDIEDMREYELEVRDYYEHRRNFPIPPFKIDIPEDLKVKVPDFYMLW